MKGSPEVIDALNKVYRLLLANEIQAHTQEHLLEAEDYTCLASWWHKIEEKGHRNLVHPLMNRINALGSQPEPTFGFKPILGFPASKLPDAVAATIGRLEEIHRAYVDACEAAEADDDYVTEKMIWCHLEWLEKLIGKFEDRAAKIERIGLKEFLAERLD